MEKHTAKRLNTPGTQPRYEYRGYEIANVSGSSYGRGWLAFIGPVDYYFTTLESAKSHIDDHIGFEAGLAAGILVEAAK
jgi:hypothetical protein